MLRADILPALGHDRAEAISKLHVMQVVEAVAARGSFVAADQVLGLYQSDLQLGQRHGQLEGNPTLGLKKRNVSRRRERVLRDPEVRVLWQALDAAPKLSAEIRVALKLELLLGVRIGEALGALRSEIDFKQRIWTIPAHRTKANREHKLPLSDFTLELLRAANERAGKSIPLFPSPVDSKQIRRRSATRAVTRIAGDNGVLEIGTHDLRRTLATGLGEMGVADEVIERVLNHAPRTVAGKHYNHAKLFEGMRTALEAWSERVRGIVGGAEPVSNVRPLRIAGAKHTPRANQSGALKRAMALLTSR